mmetsp:Transcript_82589/g.101305  ORF Transcript_82589/g.101305 Transcript_82589/m.101305 type:complete len:310 (+) Transcript_82589:20-949(+)
MSQEQETIINDEIKDDIKEPTNDVDNDINDNIDTGIQESDHANSIDNESDTTILKNDISNLKNENTQLKSELNELRKKCNRLEHEFTILQQDIILLKIQNKVKYNYNKFTKNSIKKLNKNGTNSHSNDEHKCDWELINGIEYVNNNTIKRIKTSKDSSFIGSYRTTYWKESFDTGIIQVSLKIFSGSRDIFIGIIPKDSINISDNDQYIGNKYIGCREYVNSIGFYGLDGRVYLNGVMVPGFIADQLNVNDNVIISIDFHKLLLTFCIHGKKYPGISMDYKDKSVQPKSYYIGVSLFNANDKVSLIKLN